MTRNRAKRSALGPVLVVTLMALDVIGSPAIAAPRPPMPNAPKNCRPGFVYRGARPGDTVCVTLAARDQAARQNQLASSRVPHTLAASDDCLPEFVWREAYEGDHVCVTPDEKAAAAADNAAAASHTESDKPLPLQGPAVSWDPRPVGGLTAHITDRSGRAAQCTYVSDWYTRSFFLSANSRYDLVIFPAIPEFRNWNVTINCDNGAITQTQTFF